MICELEPKTRKFSGLHKPHVLIEAVVQVPSTTYNIHKASFQNKTDIERHPMLTENKKTGGTYTGKGQLRQYEAQSHSFLSGRLSLIAVLIWKKKHTY
jgi:hypothetical protein